MTVGGTPGGPDVGALEDRVARLERRLQREREARRQAEDVAEQATERLYTTLMRLEAEHLSLRTLVAAATHDIKNPLASIRGLVQLLAMPEVDEAREAQILERLTSASDYTQQLITGLLSVLSAGLDDSPHQRVRLDDVAEQVASEVQARHPHATVTTGELGEVHMPPLDAHRLLDNLAENAARYAGEEDVRIHIETVDRSPSLVTVRVGDNGPGVEEEDRGRIFELFQRGAGRDRRQGSGVGLALCARLAQSVGGDLVLSSDPSPLGGAAFLLKLPRP